MKSEKLLDNTLNILIAIPTLNSYRLLSKLVISLRNQEFIHWRVLFIDGFSSKEHCDYLDKICNSEPRFSWISQSDINSGIFGAMNDAFALVKHNEWLLFWGSDDWAASPRVLSELVEEIEEGFSSGMAYDLIVSQGRYFNDKNESKRLSKFSFIKKNLFLKGNEFRNMLFLGSTPPHQSTLISPSARNLIYEYSENYELSADLDYFLKLSRFNNLSVKVVDIELVNMSDQGVSGKKTCQRLTEVYKAYYNSFGLFWFIPFLFRYLVKICTKFSIKG